LADFARLASLMHGLTTPTIQLIRPRIQIHLAGLVDGDEHTREQHAQGGGGYGHVAQLAAGSAVAHGRGVGNAKLTFTYVPTAPSSRKILHLYGMTMLAAAGRTLLWGSLLVGLPGRYGAGNSAAAQAFGITAVQPPLVEQLPVLPDWGGPEATKLAIEQSIEWPLDAPRPAGRVVVRFTIEPTGATDSVRIVRGLSADADAAVLAAVRRLPAFVPGRQGGRPVRVAYTLGVALPPPPTGLALARYHDAQTRQQGQARRLPGEANTTFLRRVLPVAYAQSHGLLAYTWRPGAFGKQLFFSVKDEEGNAALFVLDPYQANTYAVQVLPITSQGDITTMEALFFADANHDGRKDLLALSSCSLKERVKQDRQWMFVHNTHYRTDIWQYLDLDKAGRPQYEQSSERPDLDDLPTAAEVRGALATPSHPRRPGPAKAARPAKAAN
jgi:TonB family protein